MECTGKREKVVVLLAVWIVITISIPSTPILADYVTIGSSDDPCDLDATHDDYIAVFNGGLLNLLPGGYASLGIYVNTGGYINIYGSHEYSATDTSVQIAPSANVILFTDSIGYIQLETASGPYATLDGTTIIVDSTNGWTGKLTWIYEGNQYSLNIGTSSDITVEIVGGSDTIAVDIDIKPGSYPNSINLGSKGVVPVAILSTSTFDANTVDPDTVELAGADVAVRGKSNKLLAHEEDVNDDGLMDLVCQVETENLDPDQLQEGYAILTGSTYDGQAIEGSDEITIVPAE